MASGASMHRLRTSILEMQHTYTSDFTMLHTKKLLPIVVLGVWCWASSSQCCGAPSCINMHTSRCMCSASNSESKTFCSIRRELYLTKLWDDPNRWAARRSDKWRSASKAPTMANWSSSFFEGSYVVNVDLVTKGTLPSKWPNPLLDYELRRWPWAELWAKLTPYLLGAPQFSVQWHKLTPLFERQLLH